MICKVFSCSSVWTHTVWFIMLKYTKIQMRLQLFIGLNTFSMIYIAETYKDYINTIVEICSTRLTTAPRWLNMQRHLQLFISLNTFSMIYIVETYKDIFSCLSVWTHSVWFILLKHTKASSVDHQFEPFQYDLYCWNIQRNLQLFISLNTFSMVYIVETYKGLFSCLTGWTHSVWFILVKHTKTSSVVYQFGHIQHDLYCWNIQRHLQLFISLNTFSMIYIVETYKGIFSCLSVWTHSFWFVLLKHAKTSSVVYQFEHIRYDIYCWNIQRHLQLFIT